MGNLWYHVNHIPFVTANHTVVFTGCCRVCFYRCSAPLLPQEGINVPTIVLACKTPSWFPDDLSLMSKTNVV